MTKQDLSGDLIIVEFGVKVASTSPANTANILAMVTVNKENVASTVCKTYISSGVFVF